MQAENVRQQAIEAHFVKDFLPGAASKVSVSLDLLLD